MPFLQYIIDNVPERNNLLEIGCSNGATSYAYSKLFDHVITVDLGEYPTWEELKQVTDNVEYWLNDTHSKEFEDRLSALNIKFDVIFIDGDHTAEGSRKDYEVAVKFLAPGGLIAFHDILETDNHKLYDCWVHLTWQELENNPQVYGKSTSIIHLENSENQIYDNINNAMNDFNNWGGIGVLHPGSYIKKELEQITLVGIDCIDIKRLVKAAKISMDYCKFASVKLFTSIDHEPVDGIEFVNIPKITSLAGYSLFIIKELYKYIDTSHCLVIQHDGFVTNPGSWSNEYLEYDYIGAVTTFHNGSKEVGNGGFSLRSKKLLELLPALPIDNLNLTEDEFICSTHKDTLIESGIKFAPIGLATSFSIDQGEWNGQFGFHNYTLTNLNNWKSYNHYFKTLDRELKPSDITLVSLFTEHIKRYALITTQVMFDYTQKHGYKFLCFDQQISPNRPPSWSKIPAIMEAFDEGAEWAFWVDADALILNPFHKIEEFIDNEKDIVITKDENGINCGMILFHNTAWTRYFLNKLWSMEQYINHKWWEQGAFHELYTYPGVSERIKVLNQRSFNSYFGDYSLTDFILHVAGTPEYMRYAIIKSLYSYIYNRESSEVALHSGNMGDVLYCLPVFKSLDVRKIVLYNNPDPLYTMHPSHCEIIKPLLEAEGYSVEITSNPYQDHIDYYMDIFREKSQDLFRKHLTLCHAEKFELEPDLIEKSLHAPPSVIADVVINRTARYQNGSFDWYYLLNDIQSKIIFLGTKTEYDTFCCQTMLRNVAYYPTKNLLDAARIISGAKVFIGNQSTPYAIAEGLKVNRIQETCKEVPNCKGLTDNAVDVEDKTDLFFAKAKLHEWLNLPFDSEAKIPKNVMLYTTVYIDSEYGLQRVRNWINFYLPRKEKLGFTHMCLIDDGSPVEWIEKLNEEIPIELKSMDYKFYNGSPLLSVPGHLSEELPNWVRFPDRLGRPHHGLFPGWWRSYSFGAELSYIHKFDKLIFIDSDAYLLSDRVFEFLKNQSTGFGSMYSPVSNYRETSIQWCMASEFERIRKFWKRRGQMMTDFWWAINLHQAQYVPEEMLPFNNNLDDVKQFIGDRYGDDHYPEIPNYELDFICNTTDISLNGKFHHKENGKLNVLTEKLKSVSV